MPPPRLLWRHVVINTHASWLHGDPRGFRTRRHRIHSSGDYRHPPPRGEHRGLYVHQRRESSPEVKIPLKVRAVVGRALVRFLLDQRLRVVAVAVAKVHAHALVEMVDNIREVKHITGEAKRFSSRAVTDSIPRALWSAGGKFVRVEDDDHLSSASDYVLYDQGPWAWTWSFRDRSMEGVIGRKRPTEAQRRPTPKLIPERRTAPE